MAPPLLEELVEEILLRLPPDDPARLVQAALVCKTWCANVSGAGFRRRFGKFHGAPPLLGFISNVCMQDGRFAGEAEFVPTCSVPASRVHSSRGNVRVVDAHHGRVLLHRISGGCGIPRSHVLMVWDRTTDEQEEVPVLPVERYMHSWTIWTAAVLCAAGGPCDHLDCRRGPFLIVFVGYHQTHSETVLCTYSSSTASWSEPISSDQLPYGHYTSTHVAHVESALYFGVLKADHILKFDLESQQISWIRMPPTCSNCRHYMLTTTEGGGLGLATIHESSNLYLLWSRDAVSQVDATWTQSRVIDLKTLLPVHAVLASPRLLGLTVGTGVIFVMSDNVLFAIDLKTHKVIKEVSKASKIYSGVPYMSFYTPVALGAVSTAEGP